MSIDSSNGVNAQDMQLQAGGAGGSARGSASQADQFSWFEAMARAWGEGLQRESDNILELSAEMRNGTGGSDSTQNQVELQAQIQRFSFLSAASNNSIKTAGDSLESLARRN